MSRRPIDAGIDPGGPEDEPGGPGVAPEDFKEAMAHWPAGVSVVAVRDEDDGRIYATTVSSLGGVSAEPPRILFSLGPGAQVLPFLDEGGRFVVNVLAAGQQRWASLFTDSYPVGPSPFPDEGDPVIPDCHVTLICTVDRIVPVDANRLVVGLVVGGEVDEGSEPLIRHRRRYGSVDLPEP